MKKILFILALFFSFAAAAQNPTNYTRIGNRYRWISGMFDSALYVPRYNGTPSGVRAGEVSVIDGMVAVDTANSRFYIYSGGAWVRVANYSEITGGTVTSVSGTTNRITSTGGTTPVIDISASYVGQTSITTLGTVTTGTWGTGAVIGKPTMTLGSDADGDMYYRASGVLTRLPKGTSAQHLIGGTVPSWVDTAVGGGGGIGGFADSVANVLDYGAVGDGSTEDSTAFQSAIATGLPVYVPKGTYKITATLYLNDNQTIFGLGNKSILYTTATKAIIKTADSCNVLNLSFRGTGSTNAFPSINDTTQQMGVWINGFNNKVSGCNFFKILGRAVWIYSPLIANMEGNLITGNNADSNTVAFCAGFGSNYGTFANNSARYNYGGYYEDGAANMTNDGNIYQGNTYAMYWATESLRGSVVNCQLNHSNVVFEEGSLYGMLITNCSFFNTNLTIGSVDTVKYLVFENNRFVDCTIAGTRADSCYIRDGKFQGTVTTSGSGIIYQDIAGSTKPFSVPSDAITAGTNVTITGTGSSADPFVIGASGGAPGGSNKQIQYNNSGSFGGSGNMTQETNQILIASGSSTNPLVVRGHEDNGQGSITEWQEHSASAVLVSVNQDTTITLRDYSGTVTSPAANFGKVYSRDDSLRYKNSAGTEFTLGVASGGSQTPWTSDINADGYTLNGNDGANEDLTLIGTSHATKATSTVKIQPTGGNVGIGTGTVTSPFLVEMLGSATNTSILNLNTAESYPTWLSFGSAFGNNGYFNGIFNGTQFVIGPSSGSFRIAQGANLIQTWDVDNGAFVSRRFQEKQGTDVASAAGAITLSSDGNSFEITGTSAITLISNVNWQNGSVIYLIFTSTATLTDGTANSGTNIGMELAGGANFTGSADDVVTLVLSEVGGTQRWREVARSVN